MNVTHPNVDLQTVQDFGAEWNRFDQSALAGAEHEQLFARYFRIFPWDALPENAVGFDLGCGSGRWARMVAPRVGKLICIDAGAEALAVARQALKGQTNCEFHHASVDALPLADDSMDFGYSLGVLHHVPDTRAGIEACVRKLKTGAPFLMYLYYAFDNRPKWFRMLWKTSDIARLGISRLPAKMKHAVADAIALAVYLPIARSAYVLERTGFAVSNFPLSAYRDKSFYTMRTDALDRFGTRLEHRFTRAQIETMMLQAGLDNIVFSADVPFWCAVGIKG